MKFNSYNKFFTNFANKTKMHIIYSLKEKPLTVTEISKKINAEQSKVSHNLRKLSKCHILESKRQGKNIIYSLNNKTVVPMLKIVEKHVKLNCPMCCEK